MSEVTKKRDEPQADLPAANRHDDLTRARRRRLLLGAAAVPTVYTLTSGAGVAAASLTCWDRAQQTAPAQRVTAVPDQWARGQMKSGTTWPGNTTMAYCMKDPKDQTLGCTDPLNPDQSAASTYWWTSGQRTLEAQGGIRHIPKTPGYGLLYIDRTGTIQAFDPQAYPGVELKNLSIACVGSATLATKSTLG